MKRNNSDKSWMERYAPLGINLAQEVLYWVMTMTISTVWSMQFLLSYWNVYEKLFEWRGQKRVLMEGAMVPFFETLTENLFEVFFLVLIYCVLTAVYHYFYHYQGSKMMYLMKRLPKKLELHIRCWTLPVVGTVIAVVWMLILKFIYYSNYLLCTPNQCLPL